MRPERSRASGAISLAVLLGACAGPAPPAAEGRAGALPRLEPMVTIGCGACEGVEQLTPSGVDVRPSRLVVHDRHEPLIRVFSLPGGAVEESFGNGGQGPGELEFADGPVFVSRQGRVLVYDLAGLQDFDSTGVFLARHRWPPSLPLSFYFQPQRERLYVLTAPPPWASVSGGAGQRQVVAYDPDSASFGPHEVVTSRDMPHRADDPAETVAGAVAAAADGRVLLADSARYRLFWFDADGRPIRDFGRELERPTLPPDDLRRLEQFRRQTGNASEIDATRDHFGPHGLYFDGRGRLWVQTNRWSENGDACHTTTFDLFAPDDAYLGEVRVAVRFGDSFPVVALRGDLLAGAYPGEDGEARVGVWRIVDDATTDAER